MRLGIRSLVLPFLRAALVLLLCLVSPQASGAAPTALLTWVELPIDLASSLSQVALQSCARQGADVSVSLVNAQGQLQVFLKGDSAAPHTAELSQHKAYTAVSLAALQGMHTTTELADALRQSKAPIGSLPLPADSVEAITPIPGGVVLRHGERLLGGLGVSGARQGLIDERCALAADTWLSEQLGPFSDHGL
jgi:uncharacterized protein GlcG (DUF336 family)